MIKEKLNRNPFMLSPGYFYTQAWNNMEMATKGILNWKYNCVYQLEPKGLTGYRQVLDLQSMQLNHVCRSGGMMHTPTASQDSFIILLIEKCDGQACLGTMKLNKGDIIFFDCTCVYNFINSGAIEFRILSIQKQSLGEQLPSLEKLIHHRIHDTDSSLSCVLKQVWQYFTESSGKTKEIDAFQKAEDKILHVIMTLLFEQTPEQQKLTKSETIVMAIRDQVFHHMDGAINISAFAKQYQISEQSLQMSFKSLFGYTPKRFFRLLKLNLAYHDLKNNDSKQTTVLSIAHKWGFNHIGRFSKYYTQLFGENPSVTLKTLQNKHQDIADSCILRQEEAT